MSRLRFNKVAAPSAPAANKIEMYYDSTDLKVKTINEKGQSNNLELDGWRDRPIIYNGSFEFIQRQVPTTITYTNTTTRAYSFDRWCHAAEANGVSILRADTEISKEAGLSSRYYGQYTKTTGAGKVIVMQPLGATSIMNLRGNKVRMQFSLKASESLTFRIGLMQLQAAGTADTFSTTPVTFSSIAGNDGTLAANLAWIVPDANSEDNGTISGNAMSCLVTASWQRFSCTFTVPIDCHNLVLAVWSNAQLLHTGPIQSFSISDAGLYEGTEIRTNFVPYASILELLRVQKYFAKSFPIGITPAASTTVANAGYGTCSLCGKATTGVNIIPIRWPIRMRIAPTVAFFTPVGAGTVAYRHNGTTPAVNGTTAVFTNATTDIGTVVSTAGDANAAVGDLISIHWTASAEI